MRKYTQNCDPSVYAERAMSPPSSLRPPKPGDGGMLVGRSSLHPATILKQKAAACAGLRERSTASRLRGGNSSSVQDPGGAARTGTEHWDLSGADAWLPVPNALSAKPSWLHLSTECRKP